ncbi:MAG: hypothetical protein MIL41_21565 [Hyphomicrobiales bacterium]|jgi:hypothetical protein
MPRFYFDIHDGELLPDEEGTECADFEAAREKVLASLPDVAGWITPVDSDNQAVSVLVRDETGREIYTATLTFAASRLDQPAS